MQRVGVVRAGVVNAIFRDNGQELGSVEELRSIVKRFERKDYYF